MVDAWWEEEDGELEGEEYVGSERQTSVRERHWYHPDGEDTPGSCPVGWRNPTGGTWICTLKEGHPGKHVGGYGLNSCGARWQVREHYKGLDVGPDDGV